jgi:asparagine synthase (glutamine-hydrolysing)
MCGIVGFLSRGNFKLLQGTLHEAVSSLSHRGPDDSGLFFDKSSGVGLGQSFGRTWASVSEFQ